MNRTTDAPCGKPSDNPRAPFAPAFSAAPQTPDAVPPVLASTTLGQMKDALARLGFSLSAQDTATLEDDRRVALAQNERVEFAVPPIVAIAEELGRSPFLLQETLLDTLAQAQACFYRLRGDIDLSIPDEELAYALARRFDAVEGDLDAFGATEPEDIASFLDGLCDEQAVCAECANGEYRIADDEGVEYAFRPQEWEYDAFAPGWDEEEWAGDLDE